jgi:hypothetical protein
MFIGECMELINIFSIVAALGVVIGVFTYFANESKRTDRLAGICVFICMLYLCCVLPY